MTYISNNLAVRLSIGVLQRKWRMRGLGALSNASPSTSKLVANRPTCFYGNSKDGRLFGLTQRNPSFAAMMLSPADNCGRQISDLCDYCFTLILTFNLSLILTSALTLSLSLMSHLLSLYLILVTSCSSLCFSSFPLQSYHHSRFHPYWTTQSRSEFSF